MPEPTTPMSSEGFCYVAMRPGVPGAYAACADMASMPKETARFVADEIKRGAIVERVPTEDARRLLGEYIKSPEYRASLKPKARKR